MSTETLTIIAQNGQWVVLTDNPDTAKLFGTNVLPTPFSCITTALSDVVAKITKLNPYSIVKTA